MKNCLPSLVKNFEPTAEMVGIELMTLEKMPNSRQSRERRAMLRLVKREKLSIAGLDICCSV